MTTFVLEPGWLRSARLARGLTQLALAEKLGVHRTQITRWERDDMKLELPWLLHLCSALRLRLLLYPLADSSLAAIHSSGP